MPQEKKVREVEELTDKLSLCAVAVATDFRGMSVKAMTDMRRHLRQQGIEYRVVKNTLTQRAADAAGRPEVKDILEGPTGFVFGYDDPVQPVKVLVEYLRVNRLPLEIRGAVLDGTVYKGEQARALATLPPREELAAQLVGQLAGPVFRLATVLNRPLYNLVFTLNGPLRGLMAVLQNRVAQQGG